MNFSTTISHSIKEALQELKKREVLSIGIMESLYNAVVNIFIFSWTPLLEKSTDVKNMQVGFVFLCFVTSVIIGTSIFEFFIITLKSKFYVSMSAVLFIDMLLFMNVYVNDNFTVRLISLACIEVNLSLKIEILNISHSVGNHWLLSSSQFNCKI